MTTETKRGNWKPGQSGNPKGRPPGITEAGKLRAAIGEDIPAIIEKLRERALEGDTQAARLLLERVLPAVKPIEATVKIDIPLDADLTTQGEAIVNAVAQGIIAPGQAGALLSGLGSVAKLKEIDELTKRIEALEAGAKR